MKLNVNLVGVKIWTAENVSFLLRHAKHFFGCPFSGPVGATETETNYQEYLQ